MGTQVAIKILLSLSLAALLSACAGAPNADQAARVAQGRDDLQGGTDSTVDQYGFKEKCANGSSAVGYVADGGGATGTFKSRVDGLVSASIDPATFGEISGTPGAATGIDFRIRIRGSATNNQVDITKTAVQLMIFDSFVGKLDSNGKLVKEYPITITKANDARVDSSAKTFEVTLSDNYGSIVVKGNWNSTTAQGTVTYQNTKHFNNGTPAGGTLGAFVMPSCALFQ